MPFFHECVRCLVGGPPSLYIRFGALILFFPLLVGGSLLAARLTEPGRSRDRAVIAVSLSCTFGLLFALLVLTSDWPAHYSPLVLHRGPFSWPAGCTSREYLDGDQISLSCHDYWNALPRKLVFDHGLPWENGRTEQDYIRVGSEAVNFSCNYFTEKCTVRHAEHNVFQ